MAIVKDLIVQGQSSFIGEISGPKFKVNGGTSSLFMKADGSLDSTTYLTSSDGAVIGPASSTNGNIAIFDGTTGKVIKNSGYTIATSVPSGAVFTDASVTSANNHYKATGVANGTKSASGATGTAEATVQVVTGVTTDAAGHVTGIVSGAATDTNTKVTSAANHYTPATASGQNKSASATGATAAWSIDVVKGVTLNTDGKGHVTGISVTSGKIPANPNTDVNVRQALLSTNSNRPLLMSYGLTSSSDTNVDNIAYRNNSIYGNPSTGTITAKHFIVSGSSGTGTDEVISGGTISHSALGAALDSTKQIDALFV